MECSHKTQGEIDKEVLLKPATPGFKISLENATEELKGVKEKRKNPTTAERRQAIKNKLAARGEVWDRKKWRRGRKRPVSKVSDTPSAPSQSENPFPSVTMECSHETLTEIDKEVLLKLATSDFTISLEDATEQIKMPVTEASLTLSGSSQSENLFQSVTVECSHETPSEVKEVKLLKPPTPDLTTSLEDATEQLEGVKEKRKNPTMAERRQAVKDKLAARGEVWDPKKWRRGKRKPVSKASLTLSGSSQSDNPFKCVTVERSHETLSEVKEDKLLKLPTPDFTTSLQDATEQPKGVKEKRKHLTTAERRQAIKEKLAARGEVYDPKKWRRGIKKPVTEVSTTPSGSSQLENPFRRKVCYEKDYYKSEQLSPSMFGSTNQPYSNKRKKRKEIRRKMGAAMLGSGSHMSGLQITNPDPFLQWRSPNQPSSNQSNMNKRSLPMESYQSTNNPNPFLVEPFQSGNDNRPFPVESYQSNNSQKPYQVEPFQSGNIPMESFQSLNDLKSYPMEPLKYVNNKKLYPMEPFRKLRGNIKIEKLGQFPELIIMNLHKGTKVLTGLKLLQKCFAESPYGPLQVDTIDRGFYVMTRLLCYGVCIAEGEGKKRLEAETKAVYSLLKKLRTTNYFIEVKQSYFPRKKYRCPEFVTNPDPSQSHIYKVVCLRERNGPAFIYPLSGAVHYVSSEQELWEYVQHHGNSRSRADLFILNIDKSKFKKSKEVCYNSKLEWNPLLGSSNRAVIASPEVDPKELLLELARLGGENIKYRLLLPGQDMNTTIKAEDSDSGESDGFDAQEQPQATFSTREDMKISSQQTGNFQHHKDESFFPQNSGAVPTVPGSLSNVGSKTFYPGSSGAFSSKDFSFQDSQSSFHPQTSRSFPSENLTTFSVASNSATFLPQTPESRFPKTVVSQIKETVSSFKEEKIEIDPWIQQNLILMDVFNEKSELHSPREIIFQAVKKCPNLEEFIIEKKFDTETGCIAAEALIDRKVVGRGTGYHIFEVKKAAAQDALDNLKKCCLYIEVKRSYIGAMGEPPEFLRNKKIGYQDSICRIVEASRYKHKDAQGLVHIFEITNFEDFFFLDDFPLDFRNKIFSEARKLFNVRRFWNNYVCISKRIKPALVYKTLVRQNLTENEKYKIISPTGTFDLKAARKKSTLPIPRTSGTAEKDERIKGLFDFQDKYTARNKVMGHSRSKEDSRLGNPDFSTADRGFIQDRSSSLVATQQKSTRGESEIKSLFDVPSKSSIPSAIESQNFDTNRSSYSEQAKVESGWNRPNNIEPNSFGRQVETEQNFPENFAVSNQRFHADNRDSRDLMGKNTSWNRSDQLFNEEEEKLRQKYVAEHGENEPSRKRLSEMTSDVPVSRRRVDYDERGMDPREREPDRNKVPRDYHDIEGSSNSRSREHDTSGVFQRKLDNDYYRLVRSREDENFGDFQRRTDDNRIRSKERDISSDFQNRSDDGINRVRSRERDISGDFQRRSNEGINQVRSRERDISSDFQRRSNEGINQVRSRERDISGDFQSRSNDGNNQVRSRERDISGDFQRRSNDGINRVRSRERDISGDFQRRSNDGINRVRSRERDISGDFQSRSNDGNNQVRSRERDISGDFQRRSDDGINRVRSRERDISGDFQRRSNEGINRVRSRERDISGDFQRRSNDGINRVRSRERDISGEFQRRSNDGINRIRSRERDISGDFQRRSNDGINRVRSRERDISGDYQRRSVEREVISREQNRVENVGSYNRQTDRFWTRDIKRSYDQRY